MLIPFLYFQTQIKLFNLSERKCGLDLECDKLGALLNHGLKLLRITHLLWKRVMCIFFLLSLTLEKTDPLAICLQDQISRSEESLSLDEGVDDNSRNYNLDMSIN